MAIGDIVTVAGLFASKRNPEWRWWTPWRPRTVKSDELQKFRVIYETPFAQVFEEIDA